METILNRAFLYVEPKTIAHQPSYGWIGAFKSSLTDDEVKLWKLKLLNHFSLHYRINFKMNFSEFIFTFLGTLCPILNHQIFTTSLKKPSKKKTVIKLIEQHLCYQCVNIKANKWTFKYKRITNNRLLDHTQISKAIFNKKIYFYSLKFKIIKTNHYVPLLKVTFVISLTIISATCHAISSLTLSSGKLTNFFTAFFNRLLPLAKLQFCSVLIESISSNSRSYRPRADIRPKLSPATEFLRRHSKSGL